MKFRIFCFSIAVMPCFLACDKIDDPYPEPDNTLRVIWDDSVFSEPNDGLRFVLMEEFTGHTCANCPAGAEEVQKIYNAKDHFIPMTIHAVDEYAAPKVISGAPSGSFSSDYRTEEGNTYAATEYFNMTALPGGMVSRITARVSSSKWAQQTNSIIDDVAIANIEVTGYYDDSANAFGARVKVMWLQSVGDSLKLQVQLVEDSITDWQLDNRKNPPWIENYVHRHMFRRSVNGVWGIDLGAGNSGETKEFFYVRFLDPKGLGIDPKHVHIVAFIYAEPESYKVYQVNETKIMN